MGKGDDDNGGSDGSDDDVYKRRAEPMLILLSDSYSKDDSIFICDSKLSSCSAYIITYYF